MDEDPGADFVNHNYEEEESTCKRIFGCKISGLLSRAVRLIAEKEEVNIAARIVDLAVELEKLKRVDAYGNWGIFSKFIFACKLMYQQYRQLVRPALGHCSDKTPSLKRFIPIIEEFNFCFAMGTLGEESDSIIQSCDELELSYATASKPKIESDYHAWLSYQIEPDDDYDRVFGLDQSTFSNIEPDDSVVSAWDSDDYDRVFSFDPEWIGLLTLASYDDLEPIEILNIIITNQQAQGHETIIEMCDNESFAKRGTLRGGAYLARLLNRFIHNIPSGLDCFNSFREVLQNFANSVHNVNSLISQINREINVLELVVPDNDPAFNHVDVPDFIQGLLYILAKIEFAGTYQFLHSRNAQQFYVLEHWIGLRALDLLNQLKQIDHDIFQIILERNAGSPLWDAHFRDWLRSFGFATLYDMVIAP